MSEAAFFDHYKHNDQKIQYPKPHKYALDSVPFFKQVQKYNNNIFFWIQL